MISIHKTKSLFVHKLFLLLPVLLLLGSTPSVAGDGNLIKNGDFEDVTRGQLNMWSTEIYGDDVESVRFYVESEGAYSGTHYVTIENITVGKGHPICLIAGPCVLEDESTVMRIAEKVKVIASRYRIPYIFKASYEKDNRGSASGYSSLGLSG